MKKAIEQIKKHWLANLITFIISFLVGVAIFLVYFLTRNSRTITEACNASAVSTAVLLLGGLLAWMAHLGVFDIFSFGFKQLGSMFFAKNPIRDGNYADYQAEKREKRSNSSYGFVAVIASGVLFAISLIVLDILYFVSM